jgi:hypothetical protein
VDTGAYRVAETGLDTAFRDSEEEGDCVQGFRKAMYGPRSKVTDLLGKNREGLV